MQRADLADLNAFVTIAEHLSFRAAAGRLGVTPSALSHTMRQLEERFGVRLLHRTTRSVSLTDAGVRLLARLRPAIDQIAGALEGLAEERERPFGRLRLYATHMAATAVIARVWARFLATYPDVHLEVRLGEAPIDIVGRGFDAGIGPQDRIAGNMIAVPVMGPTRVAVIGAPLYFSRRRTPRVPEDLLRHTCVRYRRHQDGDELDWVFERDGVSQRLSVHGQVMVNNPDLAIRAAVDGLGIAYTIEAQVEPFLRSGHVIRVLEDWSPSFQGLFLYHAGNRQTPAALRALIDMIALDRKADDPAVSVIENPFTADWRGQPAA
ncbi:LysR family transcriptional regulator [Acidisphaera rubrifaciens]|uniref:Transcriptional regulator LysR n=1 Tax=Acidisphaera rubrifaciens HS-AP3 TaxID=1231350 RepID=A0A0D6PB32_9PROT|nr:LysR family transcriptional regulator [Acidisphaera rubrifaciens]GAN78074.1 transcriptional regulator LysR [Acidisphaera rubrifaciens HS-AP3]